ncbi:hypothetical protein ACWD0Z_29995 [Streptomyces sp. NPDC003007]
MIAAYDPYRTHDFTALLSILIVGSAALLGVFVYLCSRLTGQRLRAYTLPAVWCDVSLLSATGSLALYMWGCLELVFVERQEVGNACAEEAGGNRVAAFHGDLIPLRLVCRTDDGQSFTVLVPDYINPSIAALLLIALACAAASVLLHRRQLRHHGRNLDR